MQGLGRAELGAHKKQTRAAGLGLWGIAGSKLQGENPCLGGARAVNVWPTWMPTLGVQGLGLWVWPRLRTTRRSRAKASVGNEDGHLMAKL